MEAVRSPCAGAAKWLLVTGGSGSTTSAGRKGEGGARCGASSRVLHFRAPSGTQQGGFSRTLLCRRATVVAAAFPRRSSPFTAFPSAEKLEKKGNGETTEASQVQTQTASEGAAESEAAVEVLQGQVESGSSPTGAVSTEHPAEGGVQPETAATESLEAGAETETTAQVETHTPSESPQADADTETVQVEAQAPSVPGTVRVRFTLHKPCEFGEEFLLVGEHPLLGSWDTDKAIPMAWSKGHVWAVEVPGFTPESSIKFKYILRSLSGKIKWQPGPDRVLQTWETTDTIVVAPDWEIAVDEDTSTADQKGAPEAIPVEGKIYEDGAGAGTTDGEAAATEVADGKLTRNVVGDGEEEPAGE
ncbi:CBM20 domain-containing protein, partial [Streptococcus anginosus]|uniref:CBM20 domain-containing protein n=1 Tax=Streptococcus anginosus TaxID=1328 RepID=UPI00398D2F95